MRIVKSAPVRRDEILQCAMRLFIERGYDATSINHIIGRAGISKGAFYHHFQSKEDLIEALAARYAEEAALAARPILDDETLDSFSRLSAFLASMRQQKVEQAAELRTTFEPLFRPENVQLYHRSQKATLAVMQPILAGIIARGVEERCFDVPDPDEAADVILGLMAGTRDIMADLYGARDELERRRHFERMVKRMRYLATVVDRILGVPEGSIELADARSIETMLSGWAATDSAA
jgi:AcrR family transcriptional regulator